jgi:tetratricopeptide (TPR) repeat protein
MGTAVALAVLAAVVGLAVSNVRINREKAQKEAALTEAEANLLLARQAVDEIYTPVADQLAILPHMQPFQRHVLQKALNFYQEFARRKGSDPAIRLEVARASSRVLSLKMALGQYDQDELRWREVITTLQQLGEELPSHRKPRLELASAHLTLGSVLISSGQTQEGEQNIRQALVLYGEVAAEQPDEPKHRARLAAALNSLGNSAQGGPGEAEKYHREAIRLCEALAAEWPDEPSYQGEWARSHFMLGQLLANVYRWPQAEAAFRQTLAIVAEAPESLSRTHYRFLTPGAQYHLALVLQAQQRTEEAEAAYRQAVTSGERNMAQWPDFPSYGRELAVYYLGLAQFLARRDRSEDAAAFKRSGLELAEKVLPDLTDDTQPRYQVIAELTDYSRRLRDAGELKAAERVLGKALELAKKLAAESPAEPRYQHQLAVTYGTLGTILIRGCRCQEAADAHREQLAIYEKLATAFPADPDYRYHQANAANFLGIALRRLPKELETSVRHHRQAIKLCESLVAQFPNQPSYRLALARSHYSLGLDLWMSGRWTEAEAAYRQALADVAPLGDQAGNFEGRYSATAPSVRNDWAWLLATCPDAKVRDPKRAVELAQKAVELDPRGSYWNTLGVAQYRAGNFQEALAALGKSMELQEGGNSFDWFFVAMVHWRLDRKDEARQWYNKAVAWMEKHQPKNEELRRFRAEAEELLGIDKK